MSYDQSKHDASAQLSAAAAQLILPYLAEIFQPKSYLELGAGYCHWARMAQDMKIDDVLAIDGSWTDLSKIRIDRDRFQIHDLVLPIVLNRKYDMALSLEVGEHVPTSASKTLVQSLTNHSDLVVFGAATPLQGGFRHINEQWQSYWQSLFKAEGYLLFDLLRPKFWDDDRIVFYYRQNAFVYVKESRSDLLEICARQAESLSTQPIIDLIHPRKFIETASYDVVLTKQLLKKLPAIVVNQISRRLGIIR